MVGDGIIDFGCWLIWSYQQNIQVQVSVWSVGALFALLCLLAIAGV